MIVNSFLLFRKCKQSSHKNLHTKFRKSLMKSLLEEFDEELGPKSRGRKSVDNHDRLQGRHFRSYITAKEGAKWKCPLQDCVPYNEKSHNLEGFKRSQTSYQC